jgi:hypothetical protein
VHRGRRAAGQPDHRVGVLDDALEAVLGDQHRQTQIVDETLQGRQHLFGGGRVQG